MDAGKIKLLTGMRRGGSGGDTEGQDCFDVEMGRIVEDVSDVVIRGRPLGGFAQAALNPAAAQPQIGGRKLHEAHGQTAILNEHIGFFTVAQHGNGAGCAFEHAGSGRAAAGEAV